MAGFGGVAEYGITVRWDKNFLKLIRLLLERRERVRAVRRRALRRHGHARRRVRARASTTSRSCIGAGKPTMLDIPNGLARGVRTASDFLMALQLTGAAKADSIANMQVRLPVVVIGGGLTAIDTATESLAYYVVQVEKFLRALRDARRARSARTRSADEMERRGARDRRGIPRARAGRSAPSAGRPRPRGGAAAHPRAAAALGRRDHRLPPAADRQPLVHAEPRGGREGARGRHRLRRGPHAARGRRRRVRRGDAACALARQRLGDDGKWREAGETGSRRARSSSPRAPSPTPCSRARTPRTSRSTASISAPATRTASRSSRECSIAKPARADVLLSRRRDGRFVSLLRRPAPVVLRQRGEGDRVDEAGLPGASRACSRSARPRSAGGGRRAHSSPRSTGELRATVHEVSGSRRPSSRSSCRRRSRRAGSSPASSTGCRISRRSPPSPSGHAPADGRPRADRRLGRPRAGPGLDDRARDGRLVATCARCSSPASRWC